MNYEKIYNSLIDRAKSRKLPKGTYCETHHIVPKCLGGSDSKDNLVKLTAEEHFLAHQLLVKMYPQEGGLIFAVQVMCYHSKTDKRMNNKLFGWIRRRVSVEQSKRSAIRMSTPEMIAMTKRIHTGKTVSEETREKLRDINLGRKDSEETREKKRIASTGRKHTPEAKAKIAESNRRRVLSDETRQKMSDAQKGKVVGPMSEEQKQKISSANKGKVRTQEMKDHLSQLNTGNKHTEESKAKMSAARKGVPKSEEYKKNMSEAKKRFYAERRAKLALEAQNVI